MCVLYGGEAAIFTSQAKVATIPETNIAPEHGLLEYQFPFGMAYFQLLR